MQVQADLDAQLRLWYGFRWHRALEELSAARHQAQKAQTTIDARRATVQRLVDQDTSLEERHRTLRNQLGDWHRESSTLHRQAEGAQRELAVSSERIRQLEARQQDLTRELEPLHERLLSQINHVESAGETVTTDRAELEALQSHLREAQSQLDKIEAERQRHEREIGANQQSLLAQLQSKIRRPGATAGGAGRPRRQHGGGAPATLQAELASALENKEILGPQLAVHRRRLGELEQATQRAPAIATGCRAAAEQVEGELSRTGEQIATQRRQADRLQDQLDMFQRLHDEGEGYSGGARAVFREIGRGKQGIIGAVADQLQVPAQLELAIETALGGRLQDVIVEQWQDAERAIQWLKGQPRRRTPFLPLDTLRPSSPIKAPSGPGVIGLASDLVSAEPRLSAVVDYLLGRVVITRDLPSARRLLDSLRERPTVVTLEGDIVRPGGSVSGGSQATRRDQSVLARERALREMPTQVEAARAALAALEEKRDGLRQQLQSYRQEMDAVSQELARWPGNSRPKARRWRS